MSPGSARLNSPTHLISVEEVQYLSSTAQHSISRKDNIGEHLYILACQAHPALVF